MVGARRGTAWGSDPGGIEAVIEALGGLGPRLGHIEADFEDPATPEQMVARAVGLFGGVDVLVANRAQQSLERVTAQELDRTWAVNARAVVLLARAFAPTRPSATRRAHRPLHLRPAPGADGRRAALRDQ